MFDDFYSYTTLFSGVIGLTLAGLLAGLQIRPEEGLQKYDRARWCLFGAFGVFGIMNLMEATLDASDGGARRYAKPADRCLDFMKIMCIFVVRSRK